MLRKTINNNIKIITRTELSTILNRYNNINIYLYPYKYNFKNIYYLYKNK